MLNNTSRSNKEAGKVDIINGAVILHIPNEIVKQLSNLRDQQKLTLEVVKGQLLISLRSEGDEISA